MINIPSPTLLQLGEMYGAMVEESDVASALPRAALDLAAWELDCATCMASRNASMLRALGITDGPAEIPLDELLNEHVHPGDLTMVNAALAQALTTDDESPVRIFHRVLSKEREIRLVEMRIKAYFHGEGIERRAFRLSSALYEVPDLVAEARLAENRVTFRTLADTMPQMVWSTLPDGYHDYFNARWYEFTGTPVGSTDGEGWNGLFHADDQARAFAVWNQSLSTGVPYEIEYRLRRYDGQYRWTLGRALPIRDENGVITRWFGTCTDIDDQKKVEQVLSISKLELERLVDERSASLVKEIEARRIADAALRQSEKLQAVGLLTGGLAHDINNVLQVVSSGIGLLKHSTPEGEKRERILGQMSRSIQTVQNLVGQMLANARVNPTVVGAVDIPVWIANIRPLLCQSIGKHITVRTDFPANLAHIAVDSSQLEAAVLNIAVNARDAMPNGGTLTLSAKNVSLEKLELRQAGQYVAITFSDTGAGMSAEIVARAFEPFFTTKAIGQGTGLGMTQIFGFAKQAGGDVELSSTLGEGTVVTLYLPRWVPS